MKRKDLTGEIFGKLTVTEMIYGKAVGNRIRTQCRCLCECGNECVVVSDKLSAGRKLSCGCDTKERKIASNRVDLTGRRFGKLVVEKMLWETKPTKVICRCDCGSITEVINTGLTSGKTASCGCLQKEIASEINTKDWTGVRSEYGVEFIVRSHKNNKGQWMWSCKCGVCGSDFVALPAKVMNGHITSCGCRKRSSKEEYIKTLLDSINVNYEEQYRIAECRDKYTLPFDFAVFKDDNSLLLIEYDGIQHYKPLDLYGGVSAFESCIQRDRIKDEFCINHNIPLLRLPYTLTDDKIKEKIINIIYP